LGVTAKRAKWAKMDLADFAVIKWGTEKLRR
jgi:hypothetical protein